MFHHRQIEGKPEAAVSAEIQAIIRQVGCQHVLAAAERANADIIMQQRCGKQFQEAFLVTHLHISGYCRSQQASHSSLS